MPDGPEGGDQLVEVKGMSEIERCAACGVPSRFVDNHLWLAGGVIVQVSDREHRMVLIESDNLDPLFKGVEGIIGVPLERIIIETKRRASREYIDRIIPPQVKEGVRNKEISLDPLIEAISVISFVMGYGKSSLVSYRFEVDDEDYITQRIEQPYSIPLWCGDFTGSTEAVTGRDNDVTYEQPEDDVIEVTCRPAEHPPQFQGRLDIRKPRFTESGIELERCGSCGGPALLSTLEWDTDRGLITSKTTGRRMAMLGSAYLEVIFDELERELGEDIPRAVVEAQRRFALGGFYSSKEVAEEAGFREQLALRGLGDLHDMRLEGGTLRMTLRNAAMHLMLVGLMQGYYESVTGHSSEVDWELSEEGVLELEVRPRS